MYASSPTSMFTNHDRVAIHLLCLHLKVARLIKKVALQAESVLKEISAKC